MIPGLIGVGQGLQNHAHWSVLAVSWGLYVCGAIIVRMPPFMNGGFEAYASGLDDDQYHRVFARLISRSQRGGGQLAQLL